MATYKRDENSPLKKSQLKNVKNVLIKVQKLSRLGHVLDKEAVSFKHEIDKWTI